MFLLRKKSLGVSICRGVSRSLTSGVPPAQPGRSKALLALEVLALVGLGGVAGVVVGGDNKVVRENLLAAGNYAKYLIDKLTPAPSAAPVVDKPKLPIISLQRFKELSEVEDRLVVTLRGIVYDVTDFTGHPGGYGRLQMASGGALEKYWSVYTQHNRGHIESILERYKIGELSPEDAVSVLESTNYANPYTNDPPPSEHLLTNTRYPYNAEGKLKDLRESWITPIGKHFVRNHSTVPDIKPEDYKLTITGAGLKETTLTLEDLKTKFPVYSVTTVIQCNGNRREDYHYIDGKNPAFGPPHWVAGAIANATWTGVRMRDIFNYCGMDVDSISTRRTSPSELEGCAVGLHGYDTDEVGNQYCCSFPFEKAIDPFGDVLVAFEMNGVPIPRQHGYPVRAIIPGHAGARNCKFLERITVTTTPCCDACNWKQYAVHAPDTPLHKLHDFELYKDELKKDPAVQEMPVQSFITFPGPGDVISFMEHGDVLTVKGIAWGGGGEAINRVDVSIDNGKTFTKADVLPNPIKERRNCHWSWVFFEKQIKLPENVKETLKSKHGVELILTSKALNQSWNVQPENAESNYNPHGCCVNHWYRVPIVLCPFATCDKPGPIGDFANKPSGGRFKTPFRNLEQPKLADNAYGPKIIDVSKESKK